MKIYYLTLIKLAEFGILKGSIRISTSKLAKTLGTTQQTASRHLIELEREGMIRREIDGRGETIFISKEGRKFLEEIYLLLKRNLEEEKSMIVKGLVFTGIGEGAYYVTRKYYEKQFISKLGFKPYPGTLNLKLIEPKTRVALESQPNIFIPGTKTKYRTYGWVKCYPAMIKDKYKACVITLERTHYDETVVEVISPHNLRKELGLKDGDVLELELIPIQQSSF